MATFTAWLIEQSTRSDGVGELSRAWQAAEGNRPKVSSPTGVFRWLEKMIAAQQLPPEAAEWYDAAHTENQQQRMIAEAAGQGLRLVREGETAEAAPGDPGVLSQVEMLLRDVTDRLDLQARFLARICTHLGIPAIEIAREQAPAAAPEPAGQPELPLDLEASQARHPSAGYAGQDLWPMLMQAADWEAAAAEEGS